MKSTEHVCGCREQELASREDLGIDVVSAPTVNLLANRSKL